MSIDPAAASIRLVPDADQSQLDWWSTTLGTKPILNSHTKRPRPIGGCPVFTEPDLRMTVCHAEGRGFEPLQPLSENPSKPEGFCKCSVVGLVGRDSCLVQRILRAWIVRRRRRSMTRAGMRCVTFLLELTAGYERQIAGLEERLARLEAQARQDSRTSSKPPSSDPPKTRAQRRAEARAKAKELMRREGEERRAGGQSGHRGAGRELEPEDRVDEIVDHYPGACGGAAGRSPRRSSSPGGGSVAARWWSCRRSA